MGPSHFSVQDRHLIPALHRTVATCAVLASHSSLLENRSSKQSGSTTGLQGMEGMSLGGELVLV